MQQLIIDTDCGIDDAIAILMALTHPNVEIVGITCVNGNVPLDRVVRNVATVLDAAGATTIPIFRGARRPLLSSPYHADAFHGADGLGDTNFPLSARPIASETAALAIIRLARENPGATLVALGPLTNIALALAIEPALPHMLGNTVLMGGAFDAIGNSTAAAEFNIYADPEAAALVFDRGLYPTCLDWNVTMRTPITWHDWDHMLTAGSLGQHFIAPISALISTRAHERARPGILWPDPLAMAVALDPTCASIYTGAVQVDTGHSAARGMTVVDRRASAITPANAQIVTAVDATRFAALLANTCAAPCYLNTTS